MARVIRRRGAGISDALQVRALAVRVAIRSSGTSRLGVRQRAHQGLQAGESLCVLRQLGFNRRQAFVFLHRLLREAFVFGIQAFNVDVRFFRLFEDSASM